MISQSVVLHIGRLTEDPSTKIFVSFAIHIAVSVFTPAKDEGMSDRCRQFSLAHRVSPRGSEGKRLGVLMRKLNSTAAAQLTERNLIVQQAFISLPLLIHKVSIAERLVMSSIACPDPLLYLTCSCGHRTALAYIA